MQTSVAFDPLLQRCYTPNDFEQSMMWLWSLFLLPNEYSRSTPVGASSELSESSVDMY